MNQNGLARPATYEICEANGCVSAVPGAVYADAQPCGERILVRCYDASGVLILARLLEYPGRLRKTRSTL